jgi:ribonuclease P protein component
MLPRTARLRTPADFSRVTRKGRRGAARTVVVHLCIGEVANADRAGLRAGFVVSKKVGNSVVRHRVVRRLRAIVASSPVELADGTDVVIRALPEAASASSVELRRDVETALQRAMGRKRR